MADLKITQRAETTTPVSTDILPLVASPATTPLDKKVTPANLITKAHGLSDGPVKISSGVMNTGDTSGLVTWSEETGTSANLVVNRGIIANNAAVVTLTLPSTAALGSVIEVCGKGAGGWKVAQNASEIIHFGVSDSTTGTGGSIASTHKYDSVKLVCTVADTEWMVVSAVGTLTVT